jgi:hypothetical protein
LTSLSDGRPIHYRFKSASRLLRETVRCHPPFPAWIRSSNRSIGKAFTAWPVQATLPTIAIPLKPEDADASLDLQAALTMSCDRLGFDYSLDYGRDVAPSLSQREESWLRQVVAGRAV